MPRAKHSVDVSGVRQCRRCKKTKPVNEFHIDRSIQGGRKKRCRPCTNHVKSKWRARNPDRVLAQKRESYQRNRSTQLQKNKSPHVKLRIYRWKLEKHFGITEGDVEAMMVRQGGVCAICKLPPSEAIGHGKKERLCIDHCHATGTVRGLLCNSCNAGLGMFRDNPELLSGAIDYLAAKRN